MVFIITIAQANLVIVMNEDMEVGAEEEAVEAVLELRLGSC